MTTAFLAWAPNMWLYPVLILSVAWISGKSRKASVVMVLAASAVLVTTIAYLLPLPGNVAATEPVYAGQVMAVALSGLPPFAAAGFVGRAQALRQRSDRVRFALGTLAGLVVLISVPYLQLALGCLFTGICP